MTPLEAQARIAALRTELARHDELYYRDATQVVPDFFYDEQKRELAELEREFPEYASPNSPTQRVGDDRSGAFETRPHRQPMLTIDNEKTEAGLRSFHARLLDALRQPDLRYTVEPKVDGASISLTYEKGVFTQALTRGNGEAGDDVTENVRTIAGLPLQLRGASADMPEIVEIRGEVYIREDEFRRINLMQEEAGLAAYANPRNLAAGSLKLLDSSDVATRRLEVVCYGIGFCSDPNLVQTQAQIHSVLRGWGLPVLERVWTVDGIDAVWTVIRELDTQRKDLPFWTDGAVVKLDSIPQQEEAGYRGADQSRRKVSPRWACAFKYAPEQAETQLLGITVQVGRTGVLTPVAELRPVDLSGSRISRATLHNRDEIRLKDIRIKDHVIIEKAGEIIPAVVAVNRAKRTAECHEFEFPSVCPKCNSPVVQRPGEVALRCPNPNCPAQLVAQLDYLAGKNVLDIDGLGGAVAEKLVQTGLVRRAFDLFALTADGLADLNLGTSEKVRMLGRSNAQRIIQAIERARALGFSRWLMAMAVPQVGATTAQDLAALFASFEEMVGSPLLARIVTLAGKEKERLQISPFSRQNPPQSAEERTARKQRYEELKREIDALTEVLNRTPLALKIGPVVARNLLEFFASERGRDALAELRRLGIVPRSEVAKLGTVGPFAGLTVVFTGTMKMGRAAAKEQVQRLGGQVRADLSASTSLLVVGESAGEKADRAKRLNVKSISEREFLALIATDESSPRRESNAIQSDLPLE